MAKEVHGRLVAWGHQPEESVFLDFDADSSIRAGEKWERLHKIRACRALVVLCSEQSMASPWCFVGITHARAMGKQYIFPVIIGECKLDGLLSEYQA